MIPSNVRVCGRLAVTAAISWLSISVASAEAPTPPTIVETSTQTTPSPGSEASSEAGSTAEPAAESSPEAPAESTTDEAASPPEDTAIATPAQDPQKNLNTVPEDGLGSDAWWSGSTRTVREILQRRPNEDLVICIGGCVERLDRVVFAQASEPTAKKPEAAVSDAAPAAGAAVAAPPVATVKASKPSNVPAPINGADASAKGSDKMQELRPALSAAAKATLQSDSALPKFVPAMAQPNAHEPAAAIPAATP
jgi:hypothetical protein